MNKKPVLMLVLFILLTVSLSSLELQNGRVRLVLNERNGSFSLFYQEKPGSSKYIPLLFQDDPRTTFFTVTLDNRVYDVAKSNDFNRTLEKTPGGANFIWSSELIEITQEFTFLTSRSSGVSDGIAIGIRIRNIGNRPLKVGLRYLLDTYLGESVRNHFMLSDGRQIEGETELLSSLPDYLISGKNGSDGQGLMIMLRSPGVTTPDSVILANWKRLNDQSWTFRANPSRDFSLPPYSINDSAVALRYMPETIESGEERSIVLAIGHYGEGGYSITSGADNQKLDKLIAELAEDDPQGQKADPKKELAAVRELINEIDSLIESGDSVPDEKLQLLNQLLDALKERRQEFND